MFRKTNLHSSIVSELLNEIVKIEPIGILEFCLLSLHTLMTTQNVKNKMVVTALWIGKGKGCFGHSAENLLWLLF